MVLDLLSFLDRGTDRLALSQGSRRVTHAQLVQLVNAMTLLLSSNGIAPDDRIALHLTNSLEFVVSVLAAYKLGCPFVPLAFADPAPRLEHILCECSPRLIVTEDPGALGDAAENYDLHILAKEPKPKQTSDDSPPSKMLPGKALSSSSEQLTPSQDIPATALAYIVYTSGSTGVPKGVAVRRESLCNYVRQTVQDFWVRLQHKDDMHHALPFRRLIWSHFLSSLGRRRSPDLLKETDSPKGPPPGNDSASSYALSLRA